MPWGVHLHRANLNVPQRELHRRTGLRRGTCRRRRWLQEAYRPVDIPSVSGPSSGEAEVVQGATDELDAPTDSQPAKTHAPPATLLYSIQAFAVVIVLVGRHF